jgi:hypothetical protein
VTPSGSPWLARITIFPVKALDGLEVEEARVRGEAGLEHDREYRFVDAQGRVANGKRFGEKMIALNTSHDLAFGELSVQASDSRLTARLPRETEEAERWMGERLGETMRLERDTAKGFPDDTEASGPTVVSRATLAEVATWFPGMDEPEARLRFRANLEIEGVPAFWEDCLYGRAGETRPFLIGDVRFEGVNPCARCAVPSRDSRSGELLDPAFAKIFAERRRATLPPWAEASRFDHYYRLIVNTRLPAGENGKTLHVGDEVRLV